MKRRSIVVNSNIGQQDDKLPVPATGGGAGPPLDLAVFLPNLAGGGAERVMVMLSNGFAQRGKRVALVLAQKSGPNLGRVHESVDVIDLASTSIPRAIPPLARFLSETRPAVLLSALAHANMAAIIARRLARVRTRVVVSERNTLSQVIKTSRRPLVWLLPLVMRAVYPDADGVIAVSKGVADDLARQIGLPRTRIEVVYNPVALDELRGASQAPPAHPWFAGQGPPVIISAGRLAPAKDHATLLRAFAILRRARLCRLVILGEGPLRADLDRLAADLGIAEDVSLPSFAADPFGWMRAAQVFVLSSHHEGFPNALVEAMACGTPVVSTDCPSGPAEILEDGKWGRLVPVGDAEALAGAIASTLDESVHPAVETRAADFSLDRALQGYARVMGLSL